HDGEILSALGRYAEFGQALRKWLEPAVERAPEHLAKRLAGSGGIRRGSSQGAPGRELLGGEITPPVIDDASQQSAWCSRVQLAEAAPYPAGRHATCPEQGIGDQFLFAAGEVVLERSSRRVRLGHDLSHPGSRHALAPDELRCAAHHALARRNDAGTRFVSGRHGSFHPPWAGFGP